MASILRIKRSELSGNPSSLAAGELAYSSLVDNGSNGGDRLYIGTGTESNNNAVNHVVIGGKYFTDIINAATDNNTNNKLVKRNNSGTASLNVIGNLTGNVTGNLTGDSAGTHTGAVIGNVTGNLTGDSAGTHTGAVIGNVTGNLTGNAATATRWLTPRNLILTGDATATFANVDGSAAISTAITLSNVNSNVGSFGSSTQVPVVTVNAKGLVTGVTTANIASTLNVAGTSGTAAINLLNDTLTITGTNGIVTSVTGTTITISGGGSSTFDTLTVTNQLTAGSISTTGTLSAGNTTVGDLSVSGNTIITGNLTVQGTTTTVNSTTVAIGDKNIELAKDAATAIAADGAGLTIRGPATPATFTYSAIDNRWNLNKDLNVSKVYGSLVGNADTASKWIAPVNLSLTGDAAGTLSSVDGSGDVSGALTLATVNTNVGEFGDAVTVPTFTVNAKGLITGASETAIPYATSSTKGLASFDSTQFSISSGAVTIAQIDGGSF